MNILIIGFGNIGKAHLSGVLKFKKKLKVFVLDKKKIKDKINDNRVKKLNEIPSNLNLDLVIISTDVFNRLEIIKKIIKNENKIKYLLLEKYLFKNKSEFKEFEKNYLKKIQKECLVNCWGNILLNLIKIKDKKNVKRITVNIDKSSYLTSLIHFLQIYKSFKKINTNSKYKLNINKIINSKRRNYKELEGKLEIFKKDFSFIYQSSKQSTAFSINFYFTKFVLSANLLNNFKVEIIDKRKKKLINFPLTSHTSANLIKAIFYRKKIDLPRYRDISQINKFIIMILKNKLSSRKFT